MDSYIFLSLSPFRLSFSPFSFPPLSLPSVYVPSLSWGPSSNPAKDPWSVVSCPIRSGRSPADKQFLVHSELKIALPVIVLL